MSMQNNIDLSLSLDDTKIIKGIAICLMLCHHLFSYSLYVGNDPVANFLGVVGKVCVSIFLLLSGYGITKQYSHLIESNDSRVGVFVTLKFILRRFLKFYFGYWLIFAISLPIGIYVFGIPLSSRYETNSVILPFIVDLFGFMGHKSYNITWWFNRTILLLYLIFPFIYIVMRKFPKLTFAISFIIMLIPIGIPFLNEMTIWLFAFVVGMIWSLKPDKINSIVRKCGKLIYIYAIVLFVVLLCFRSIRIIPYFYGLTVDGLLAASICMITALLLRDIPIVSSILSFLGKHSANIFMIHTFLFYYWLSDIIYWPKYTILIFLLLLLCCVLISVTIEFIKRKCGINKLCECILKRLR